MPSVVTSYTMGALVDLQVVGETRGAIFRTVVVLVITAAAAAAIASRFAFIKDIVQHTWCWQ